MPDCKSESARLHLKRRDLSSLLSALAASKTQSAFISFFNRFSSMEFISHTYKNCPVPSSASRIIAKARLNILPTLVQISSYDSSIVTTCPRCGGGPEDLSHVFGGCPSSNLWDDGIQKITDQFSTFLSQLNLKPPLNDSGSLKLLCFFLPQTENPPPNTSDECLRILDFRSKPLFGLLGLIPAMLFKITRTHTRLPLKDFLKVFFSWASAHILDSSSLVHEVWVERCSHPDFRKTSDS